MLHLLGVNLPDKKFVSVALTSFYGIGEATALRICAQLSIHKTCKLSDISDAQINQLSTVLSNMTIETDLRRTVRANILHHRSIGTYVGRRHAMSLPVRGQNTGNNSKTAKKLNGKWLQKREFATSSNASFPSQFPSLSQPSPFERFFNMKFL